MLNWHVALLRAVKDCVNSCEVSVYLPLSRGLCPIQSDLNYASCVQASGWLHANDFHFQMERVNVDVCRIKCRDKHRSQPTIAYLNLAAGGVPVMLGNVLINLTEHFI